MDKHSERERKKDNHRDRGKNSRIERKTNKQTCRQIETMKWDDREIKQHTIQKTQRERA